MTRAPKPIESFAPELLQALVDGSKREIVLELPYRQAVVHRARLNSLRAEMRKQEHPLYKVVAGTVISIKWGKDAGLPPEEETKSSMNVRTPKNRAAPSKLIIRPADADFGEALRKAGVEVRSIPLEPIKEHTGPAGTTPELEGDDFLSEYLKITNT